ncbi:MAG: hypothetical protein DUD39_12160 [Coriobacteriaceae bacterium]|nr:MAG: hypothetical protein DUD39_12160 [Coriobacteriaceae bacterium]
MLNHRVCKRARALCKRCVDSFHVAEWATDVLDEVRKDCWHAALWQSQTATRRSTLAQRQMIRLSPGYRQLARKPQRSSDQPIFWQSAKSPDAEQKDPP